MSHSLCCRIAKFNVVLQVVVCGFVAGTMVGISAPILVAQDSGFQYPVDVTVAADHTVYVADLNLPGIWKVVDGKAEVFFRAEKKFGTPLNRVRCIAVDGDGHVIAGDSSTWEVYRFDAMGKPQPLTGGKIGKPMGLAVSADGTIFVSDLEIHRVWSIKKDGAVKQLATVVAPIGIALDGKGDVWGISRGKNQVRKVTADGKVEIMVKDRPFTFPHDLSFNQDQQLIVSDGYGKCLWRWSAGKDPEKWVSSPMFDNPIGLAFSDGKLYVADSRAKQVFVVDNQGKVSSLIAK